MVEDLHDRECGICQFYIGFDVERAIQKQSGSTGRPVDVLDERFEAQFLRKCKNRTFMKTPCNHTFHVQCLKQWMSQDRVPVCPMCRAVLPPYFSV